MEEEILQQIQDEMERAYGRPEANEHIEPSKADAPLTVESAALRSVLSALHASYALVGQLPPEPPTLRGRIGARLVKLVQRMLFWYTPQIVHFQYSALRALEEQAKILRRAEKRIRHLEVELGKECAENRNRYRAWEDLKVAMTARVSNSQSDFAHRMQSFEAAPADTSAAERSEG
jgi:hypothetical protein